MFCLTRLGLCITLRWLYLLLYAMQFLGIPLRREYRGFCILCHIRISITMGLSKVVLNI